MTTINITLDTEPLSIVLCDSLNSYGVKRTDDNSLIALPETALTQVSALEYSYSFDDPLYDLTYAYSLKIEYTLGVFTYESYTIDGAEIGDLSFISRADAEIYFSQRLSITPWEQASELDKQKSLITATKMIQQLALYVWTTIPTPIKEATCELALALLDGRDSDTDFENLNLITSQYSSVRSTYDRTFPMEHLEAGIPSRRAWTLIRPYLDVSVGLKLSRVS